MVKAIPKAYKNPWAWNPFMLTIYTDGASSGNPGPMGIGIVIWRNDEKIKEISEYIGPGTNNIAEYSAVLRALEEAKHIGEKEIIIKTDSELIVKQFKGEYKIKNKGLKPLKQKIDGLCLSLHVSFQHIPRERNKRADYLSKQAVASVD